MKTLALVSSAALLLAGVAVASAQSTSPNEKPATPPSSINKGSEQPNARTSGTEPKAAAQATTPRKHMKKAKKHTRKKNTAATSPAAHTSGSASKSMAK